MQAYIPSDSKALLLHLGKHLKSLNFIKPKKEDLKTIIFPRTQTSCKLNKLFPELFFNLNHPEFPFALCTQEDSPLFNVVVCKSFKELLKTMEKGG